MFIRSDQKYPNSGVWCHICGDVKNLLTLIKSIMKVGRAVCIRQIFSRVSWKKYDYTSEDLNWDQLYFFFTTFNRSIDSMMIRKRRVSHEDNMIFLSSGRNPCFPAFSSSCTYYMNDSAQFSEKDPKVVKCIVSYSGVTIW